MLRKASALVIVLLAIVQPALRAEDAPQTLSISNFRLDAKRYSYSLSTQDFEAEGNVRAKYDGNSFQADKMSGNAGTRELSAENAVARVNAMIYAGLRISTRRIPIPGPPGEYALAYMITKGMMTTCDLKHPDYKFTARSIDVRPGKRAIIRKASLWLGNFKLFTVPRLSMDLRPGSGHQDYWPEPGVDKKDGFFLLFLHPLAVSDKFNAHLDLRATQRSGIQGGVSTILRVAGKYSATRVSSMIDLRTRPVAFPMQNDPNLVCTDVLRPHTFAGQLNVFADFFHRRRVFDVDAGELLVSSQPEIGLRGVSNTFPVCGSRIQAYAAAQVSWGEFEQIGLGASRSRADGRVTLATMPIPVARDTSIQPALYARISKYDNGDTFQARGGSVDVTRGFGRRLYLSGRALSFAKSGNTPFEFDDIDRFRQLQGSLLYCGKRDGLALILRYSLDQGVLYDWELSYTHKQHCLQPTLTWQNQFGLFRIDMKVLGLD